jgi:hypothetical protein
MCLHKFVEMLLLVLGVVRGNLALSVNFLLGLCYVQSRELDRVNN